MPTSKVDPARSVVPAAPASQSTKVSAKKPAAAKAKTSNSPSAGKGLPRKARKPALLPMSDGDAGVQAYIASMEPWQTAIAKRVDALVVRHVGSVIEMPQIDVSFSAGVEKLRRLNESFEGILVKAFWKSLEVLGGEHEKVGFDRGPVGI